MIGSGFVSESRMRSTLGMHQYQKPPFEPGAQYVPARNLTWGNSEHGYMTIDAARADDPATLRPLDFATMKPPCDTSLAARLYRTGFLAMLLTDDGKPMLKGDEPEPLQAIETLTEDGYRQQVDLVSDKPKPEIIRSTCPKCGRGFKAKTPPYLHLKYCKGVAA